MEDLCLLEAIYNDDLVNQLREARTSSSRHTSTNHSSYDNEFFGTSQGSKELDDYVLPAVLKPSEHFQLASRPLPGTTGRGLKLFANHFRIACNGSIVYEYEFKISPCIPSKKLNRKILHSLEEQLPELLDSHLVYDGINTIYASNPINTEKVNQTEINLKGIVNTKESPNRFKVFIVYVGRFVLDTIVSPENPESIEKLKMMHAIDTILRQTSSNRFHVILQSFFSITPQQTIDRVHNFGWGTVNLGVAREVCYGFYQNVVETFDSLTMNLDVATTTFYRPIALVEFLAEILEVPLATITDGRALSDAQKKKFNKEVSQLKVETRHCNTPRRFRISRCTLRPMENIVINISTGPDEIVSMTVAEYYKSRYDIDLKYRHLPCLEVERNRECILPIELCFVVSGQRCIKKLNEQQIANLIRATSRNAPERREAVLSLHQRLDANSDPHASEFGLQVDTQMVQLEGRVLPAPRLLYCSPVSKKQECVTTPKNGAWDMREKNFYTGIEIRKWAIVCFASNAVVSPNNIRSFVSNLEKVAGEIGMPFLEHHCFCRYAFPDQTTKILEYLHEAHPDLQLIICIVPGKSTIYGDLKRKSDALGLATQCVRTHNVTKISPHTLSNLCMKINSKLGGINVVINTPIRAISELPVLFVGCHLSRNSVPSSNESNSSLGHIDSSIACLVGSMDGHPTRFSPIFRTQPRHLDTIQDMSEMMQEAILNFHISTGFKPHKIVIYRAGISDASADVILQTELRAIRDACSMIDSGFQPGITFIGLDVTHHTRLFAAEEKDCIGNSKNVPAGTIVETGITVNNLFEFYLVSHAGIQGTSRPTKYVVLWDDNQMLPDEVHEMTFQLCHTQSRCTRSVSIPSPVYYAKLVGQRAKILMADNNFDIDRFREKARFEGMMFT